MSKAKCKATGPRNEPIPVRTILRQRRMRAERHCFCDFRGKPRKWLGD
jgi:hypothetical protein